MINIIAVFLPSFMLFVFLCFAQQGCNNVPENKKLDNDTLVWDYQDDPLSGSIKNFYSKGDYVEEFYQKGKIISRKITFRDNPKIETIFTTYQNGVRKIKTIKYHGKTPEEIITYKGEDSTVSIDVVYWNRLKW